jgi:hypothetical protein
MRRIRLALALVALATAGWLATTASALNHPVTFSLLDAPPQTDQQMGTFTFDKPPVGGDTFGFDHTLYKWAGAKKGARAGHLQVVITFVTGFGSNFDHPALILVHAQAFIPGGSVMFGGYGHISADGPSHLTLPVAGGSGTYSNVRGEIKVRDLGNGNIERSNIEFHLTP